MMKLLVTGGIGSGKSVVCRYLESKGIPVYDSDSRAKALYDNVPGLAAKVDSLFGGGLLDDNGKLDRKALAKRVFGSKEELHKLESIIHPAVLQDFLSWSEETGSETVVMESAIALKLPEYRRVFDKVIVVDAPLETRLERACSRDSSSREAVLARIAEQEMDISLADEVIVNDSSVDELYNRTDEALEKLSIFAVCKEQTTIRKHMKTDLTRILSVSGQHGLYQYIAQARTGAIAERLSDKKRTVFDMRSRITTLADISIYTSEGEMKLEEVFEKLQAVLGEENAPSAKSSSETLVALFEKAVPDYDSDRFYVSHMKKVVEWYNDLKENASLDFLKEGDEMPEETETEE